MKVTKIIIQSIDLLSNHEKCEFLGKLASSVSGNIQVVNFIATYINYAHLKGYFLSKYFITFCCLKN